MLIIVRRVFFAAKKNCHRDLDSSSKQITVENIRGISDDDNTYNVILSETQMFSEILLSYHVYLR